MRKAPSDFNADRTPLRETPRPDPQPLDPPTRSPHLRLPHGLQPSISLRAPLSRTSPQKFPVLAETTMAKKVAVIGAGPAGLVAAKTLLGTQAAGTFDVTVFDAHNRVGGMWDVRPGERGGFVSPDLRTNLSKYTVAFSDYAWEEVPLRGKELGDEMRSFSPGEGHGLEEGNESNAQNGESSVKNRDTSEQVPMFPKAWMVGQYLEGYRRRYIPERKLRLGCNVVETQQLGDKRWMVKWTKSSTVHVGKGANGLSIETPDVEEEDFDYLIASTGFFSRSRNLDIPGTSTDSCTSNVPMQHSSQFRHVKDLLPHQLPASGGSIVVIGGSISGAEAAATAAFQLSSMRYAPGSKDEERLKDVKVYHVFARPFYAVPRYFPCNPKDEDDKFNPAPNFVPDDLKMYDLSRRPPGPITPVNGRNPPERAKKSHPFFHASLGGDQSELGAPDLAHAPVEKERPAYVAITDTYSEFVRSVDIIPIRGRATAVSGNTVELKSTKGSGDELAPIKDVLGVVYATGFEPHGAVSWLPDSVKTALEYDGSSNRLPVLLNDHMLMRKEVDHLAFIGFYEGPYWGVMEMQARLIARRWSKEANRDIEYLDREKELEQLRELRDAIKNREEDVPQFWMGDYVGIMEGLSRTLSIPRATLVNGDEGEAYLQTGPVVGARYHTSSTDAQSFKHSSETDASVSKTLIDLNRTLAECSGSDGTKLVAAAAFRGMQGQWTMLRKLHSRLPGFPSGIFHGQARFLPREPTDGDGKFAQEYLYIEEGALTTETGFTLRANRRYVYRYSEIKDKISAWFVKDDGLTVDYFFNEMNFQPRKPLDDSQNRGWLAEGYHLCVEDGYTSHAEFKFRGVNLETFAINYEVKGPRKDYTSETWYGR